MKESKRHVVTDSVEQEIIKRYLAGQNTTIIAKDLGLNTGNITYSLIRNEVPRRKAADSNRRYSIDQSAFEIVSPETAYWIGIMMTDGNINITNKGHQIRLTLSGEDGKHVETFRDFLGSSHPVRKIQPHSYKGYICQPAFELSISCKPLALSLEKYGVVPNKTKTAKVIGLESNRDFWRGAIDGDGSVGYRTTPYGTHALLEFCGSHNLSLQFSKYVHTITDGKATPYKRGCVCQIVLTGKYALPVIRKLYSDCCVALPRKLATANHLINSCDENGKLYI